MEKMIKPVKNNANRVTMECQNFIKTSVYKQIYILFDMKAPS